MTLVIIAAGMGSRYGGLKQIDPMNEYGEFIIDFSIYDALYAGFDKVVFVIKEENRELFGSTVGARIGSRIKTEYVYQRLDDLPDGYSVPEGRIKPWGTAHAVLAARGVVNDNFAVINADDFYGRDAFVKLAKHFSGVSDDGGRSDSCMIGYVLRNTLTENGSVSRGECIVGDNGKLISVTERKKIRPAGEYAICDDDTENGSGRVMPYGTIVSMNCWGFTPSVLDGIYDGFERFLSRDDGDPLTREYYLPYAVTELMNAGKCEVSVYPTDACWYGVTYKEDKEHVKSSLGELIKSGIYPERLWK